MRSHGLAQANVRLVVHWNMPKSMEAFYQEAGRAGRDGERSRSVLYYDRQDECVAACHGADAVPAHDARTARS